MTNILFIEKLGGTVAPAGLQGDPPLNGSFPEHLLVLDGKNNDQWFVKMKVIFKYQDVLEAI